MIQIPAQARIFVAHQPLNFRNGIDGTAAVCRQVLAEDPMTGAVFVFRNRKGTMIRILSYDGQGFLLCTKRFSSGKLKWWVPQDWGKEILAAEIQVLLWGGNPAKAGFKEIWKKITTNH